MASISRVLQPARRAGPWLWIAAALSLGLSVTPWGQMALYPFKLFTTIVHECAHAVMTVLVGGSVQSITIQPDTSGLTLSMIPDARIFRGLVSSAGYLGASIVGCVLIVATRIEKWANAVLLLVGALMGVALVIWMRNVFAFVVVLAWSLLLVTLARVGSRAAARFLLSLLAVQVALNAVFDIRVLFLVRGVQSDAETMAGLFILPSWFWASLWMLVSVALLGGTLWITRVRRA